MRIRIKFLIVFLFISLFPILLLTYINYDSSRKALIKDTQDKLETIADLQIARIKEVGGMNSYLLTSITTDYTGLGSTGEVVIGRRGADGEIVYLTPRRFEKTANHESLSMNEALKKNESFFSDIIDYQGKSVAAVTKY